METRPLRKSVAMVATVLAVALTAFSLACGSGSGDGGAGNRFQKVSQTGMVYTADDLFALGFKQVKAYSVEGLPGASAAIFGFWRPPGGDPVDYEVRFYASHDDAVRLGTDLAEEGTGEDAVLDASEARYKEGVNERRVMFRAGPRMGGRSGIGPKYQDYAIVDNLVILCQGDLPFQSLEHCSLLAGALAEAAGS